MGGCATSLLGGAAEGGSLLGGATEGGLYVGQQALL